MGIWLVGEAGAVLLPCPGGGVCTASASASLTRLPPSDLIAHLLLALRTDEEGFATVANHAFCRRALARTATPASADAPRPGCRASPARAI